MGCRRRSVDAPPDRQVAAGDLHDVDLLAVDSQGLTGCQTAAVNQGQDGGAGGPGPSPG